MAYSIAGKIIDFTDDCECMMHPEFSALIGGNSKYASCDGAESDYAVVLVGQTAHRRYPIFDKVATVLSARYFESQADNLHPVIRQVAATHIKRACAEFGVTLPAAVNQHAVDGLRSNRLLLAKLPAYEAVPAATDNQKLASMLQFWENNYARMTPAERHEKANRLAAMPGVKLASLPRSAADYVTRETVGPLLESALRQRAAYVTKLGHTDAALEYAEVLRAVGTVQPVKIAELLSAVDAKHHVDGLYKHLLDPYRAVFGSLGKEASVAEDDSEHALRYKLETLAAETAGSYSDVLSESGKAEFAKDPVAFYKRMPKAVQEFLLSDYENRLRRHKDMPVRPHASEESIERMTAANRRGDHDAPAIPVSVGHKQERRAAKYPKMINEPISKG